MCVNMSKSKIDSLESPCIVQIVYQDHFISVTFDQSNTRSADMINPSCHIDMLKSTTWDPYSIY